MPPWIWPSTSVGLTARPTSCAATMRCTLHRAERGIHRPARNLRGEAVGGIGRALAVRVQRRGRRVEAALGLQVPSSGAARSMTRRRIDDTQPRAIAAAAAHPARHWRAQQSAARSAGAGLLRRPAADEGLAARRWSCRHRRCRSVSPSTSAKCADRQAQRIGADLRHDGGAALADIDRAVVATSARRRRQRRPACGTGWTCRYCRSRTTCRQCRRRAAAARCRALAAAASARSAAQRGRSASRHCGQPGRVRSTWPVAVASPGAQGVDDAELQPVEAEPHPPARPTALRARSPPAARRSRGRRRRAGRWCRPPAPGCGHAARDRARWRAPARGRQRSGPSWHRRRC